MSLKVTGKSKLAEALLTEEIKRNFKVEVLEEDKGAGSPTKHLHKFLGSFSSGELEEILSDSGYKTKSGAIESSKFEKIKDEGAIYKVVFKNDGSFPDEKERKAGVKILITIDNGLKLKADY